MQVHDLNPITEWIVEIAAESRNQLQLIFLRDFLANFGELLLIANHDAEVSHPLRLRFLHLEHRQKLVLAKFEECVAFSFIKLFQIENVLVQRDRLLHVVHFNSDVIASIHLHAHGRFPFFSVSAFNQFANRLFIPFPEILGHAS